VTYTQVDKNLECELVRILQEQKCESLELGGVSADIPPPDFQMIFLIRHAITHFLSSGIVLRHLYDLGIFYTAHAHEIDLERIEKILMRESQYKLYRAFMDVLHIFLGMPEILQERQQTAEVLGWQSGCWQISSRIRPGAKEGEGGEYVGSHTEGCRGSSAVQVPLEVQDGGKECIREKVLPGDRELFSVICITAHYETGFRYDKSIAFITVKQGKKDIADSVDRPAGDTGIGRAGCFGSGIVAGIGRQWNPGKQVPANALRFYWCR
jgi:hypothetical protein